MAENSHFRGQLDIQGIQIIINNITENGTVMAQKNATLVSLRFAWILHVISNSIRIITWECEIERLPPRACE